MIATKPEETIKIRPARSGEAEVLYNLITQNEEWTRFNGPYFSYTAPTQAEFKTDLFKQLCQGNTTRLIEVGNNPVGRVSYYWECEETRWLEMGVIIYDSRYWSIGIGRQALRLWISHLFSKLEIARVGLTTWSGNIRMMVCAEKLGLKLEARLRKVRYYQGEYYDSIKYGILREEWAVLDN